MYWSIFYIKTLFGISQPNTVKESIFGDEITVSKNEFTDVIP